ncbi:hypothetical protein, partial [Oleiphilus sp. HI0061]|uniref:hypothetical protein n=1 Tax=Oleiphilus sp. HI0061 TaxID=1822239 RepID=UPI001E3CAE4B
MATSSMGSKLSDIATTIKLKLGELLSIDKAVGVGRPPRYKPKAMGVEQLAQTPKGVPSKAPINA